MLKLFAFSRHAFDNEGESRALVDNWRAVSEPPQRYGPAEPVRFALDDAEADAARLLSTDRALFLQRSRPSATWAFAWQPGRISQWYAEFAGAAAPDADHWIAFFRRFPVAWAGLAPQAHWQARHWLVEEDEDGDEVESKVGLGVADGLPGVFWTTVFGAEATAHFGRERLLALPVNRREDLGAAGVLLRTDASPPVGPLPGPAEAAVRDALGARYFFDIAAPRSARVAIPGLG